MFQVELGIQEGVPLAAWCSIGIGGPARYFAEANSEETLARLLAWAATRDVPVLLLGGGSNLLISDAGYQGLVIHTTMRGIDELPNSDGSVDVTAAAGENWDAFVAHCVAGELAGIECLSGIPGCVGASPIQNIGAYGQEVRETIVRVDAIDRANGQPCSFPNADCEFAYRWSRFKGRDRDKYVITLVTFRLQRSVPAAIRYGDLVRYFTAKLIHQPTVGEVRDAVLEVRRQKAMVLDPNEPNSRSCGSFFTNPIVNEEEYQVVLDVLKRENLLKPDEKMPAFDAECGHKKLSAAWLMERAGLRKGMRHGHVGLSQKHVLAIVNYGGGTAAEAVELVRIVRDAVLHRFGVQLEPEPIFVGF